MYQEHFKKNKAFIILVTISVILIALRIYFLINPGEQSYNALVWGTLYQVVAFWGAVCGIVLSRLWGGFKSLMGKITLLFSFGLLAQCFGQSVSSYYFFTGGTVAYPSIADIGFFGSVLFYIYAVILLARVAGAHISMKSFGSKIAALIFPLALLVGSYMIFLKGYTIDPTNPIKTILDFGYPLGQAFYISIAILILAISRNLLGGLMKRPIIFLIIALLCQYLSDFTFLYQSNAGTYVAGGIVDFMYFVAYFAMAFSLIQFGAVFEKITNSQPVAPTTTK